MRKCIFLAFIFSACTSTFNEEQNLESDAALASFWKTNFDNLLVQNHEDSVIVTFIDSFLRTIFITDSSTVKLSQSFFDFGSSQLFSNQELARLAFKASIKSQSNFGKDSFNLQSVRALTNIGFTYLLEGDHLTAIRYFDSVVKFKVQFPVFPTTFALIRKGESLAQLGELNEAIKTLNSAELIFNDAAQNKINLDADAWSRTRKRIFDLYVQKANALILKKEFYEAVQICEKGIMIYRQFADPPDTLNGIAALNLIKGNSLLEIADGYENLDSKKMWLDLARQAYHTANTYYKMNGNPDFQVFALNNIGTTFYKQYKYDDALNAYQNAIFQNSNNGNILDQSQYYSSLLNRGSSFYKLGRIDSALASYNQLLSLFDKQVSDHLPNIRVLSKDYNLSCFLLGSLGRCYLAKSLEDSSSHLKSATAYDSLSLLLNFMRGNLLNDYAKMGLAQKSRLWIPDAVIDMATLYFQTKNVGFQEKVFHFIEHGKAFSLLEASRLNNAAALLPIHLQKLQMELSKLQLDAITNKDLEAEVSSKQHVFFERLQKEAPAYYALKYQGIRNNPQQVQDHILEADQTMLEYFIHDSLLLILAIQKDTFFLDTAHITKAELFKRVSAFRSNMNPVDSSGRISEAKQAAFCKQSYELYQLLVGRVNNRIRLNHRLVIIPDGPLNDLSFDALLCDWTPEHNYIPDLVKNEKFLVQQYAISYCFSASLLEEMKKQVKEPSLNSTLALFAPQFQKSSTLLPFMNYQQEEIHKIKQQIPSSRLAKVSSKENFIRATKTNAFMHIATHGFESPDPDQSFIAFQQTSNTPDTSQFLFLKELYHIPMRQELLTLTACETALGPLKEGEGNISLARGFAYAGVKAMITTLWKIQTNGASKIIPEFYKNYLVTGKSKDVALSESKRAYLKAGKAVYPDEWAGLILIGNATKYTPKQKMLSYLWIFYGSAILITLIYFWRRQKQQAA